MSSGYRNENEQRQLGIPTSFPDYGFLGHFFIPFKLVIHPELGHGQLILRMADRPMKWKNLQ